MFQSRWRNLLRRWFQASGGRGRTARRRRPRPGVEALEERLLLDTGLPAAIVVGRTLSAYTVPDVQNNQLTITYTVYNEQADPVSGVLLTDTLANGVTFQSASQLPDRSGQQLAWSLGTIQGFDRASVTLTVNLTNPIPLQLDAGAQAFATLDAGAVSNTTPAATLRQGSVDPSLLASTPDANTTDPFVQEKAAELNYDPQQIFNYLHNDVGYNSYTGSLRGARGTLWSDAGNALDVASLGVALMRASGIPAQYVSGTLSQGQAQQLILSMFPASFQTVGAVPAGTPTNDPANDPQLLAETESHYWFQFDNGSGMKDADPLLVGAAIGQSFTPSTSTFTEVPDNLRQKTEVSLTAEIYSQAAAAFGLSDGLSDTVVLNQTFNDVDLVGRPLTIGNFVSSSAFGFTITAQTNTYTPYIVVGDDALPDDQLPEAITGTPYQEALTSFPLSSRILTGLFLNVTTSGPGTTSETFNRALVDRIGYAARQGLAPPESVSADPSGPPIITPFDLTTLNILPGIQDPHAAQLAQGRAAGELAGASSGAGATTPAQVNALIAAARSELASLAVGSDQETANLATGASVAAYFSAPRVTLFSSREVTTDGQSSLSFGFDLVNDSVRAVVAPGQNAQAKLGFAAARGLFDSSLEALSLPVAPGAQNLSAILIIQRAMQQGIALTTLDANNLSRLSTYGLSPDAAARITTDVQNGLIVIVPTQPLTVNGAPTTAWLEFDPTTGETIAVGQGGGHQGLVVYAAGLAVTAAIISGAFNVITSQLLSPTPLTPQQQVKEFVVGAATGIVAGLAFELFVTVAIVGTALGLGVDYLLALKHLDPPLAPDTTTLNIPFPDTAGATAGAQVDEQPNRVAGPAAGSSGVPHAVASGSLTASWVGAATSTFLASSLGATAATVVDSQGDTVGTGTATLSALGPTAVSISGGPQFSVNGSGSLSFYGPAKSSLGVSGDWDSYTATVTGNVSITVPVPEGTLTLNGQALPAGTYTITTNSATLSGSGPSSSPNFAGSASVTATNGAVNLGPGSGNVTVAGQSLDLTSGATLTGYTGTMAVAAGGGPGLDEVTLNGNAANVLTVSASPATPATDQSTPVTFPVNVRTGFADTYSLTAQAPPGWTVTIDGNGNVTALPAPGLQAGSYPIQVVVRSTTNPGLVAQTTIEVAIAPTQPGITLSVQQDSGFTVPFHGAQVPTAFRAVIQNTGPAADTFDLTLSNVPSGFTVLDSGSSVTIPAGQTGIVGIYLQPSGGQLPAKDTPASFTVTATSTSNPAVTQTVNESFTIPAIDGVTVAASPTQVTSTPGTPTTVTLTLANVGNVSENVTLAATAPTDLTVRGLSPMSLDRGQTATETITLTPDASATLNDTLAATITVTYGPAAAPMTASTEVDVLVRSPQTVAVSQAAVAATQGNNSDLATNLSSLGDIIAQLQATPTDPGSCGRATFLLGNLSALLGADPGLASFVSQLQPLQAKASACDGAGLLALVPAFFNGLNSTLAVEATQQFIVSVSPNEVDLQPGQSQAFSVQLANTGPDPVNLTLSAPGLPANVTATFGQTQVTLAPGATDTVSVTLDQTLVSSKLFTLDVTAAATVAQHTATAVIAVRPAAADVTGVTLSATTINAGTPETVSAQVFNTANVARSVLAHVDVLDGSNAVVSSLPDVPVTLTPGSDSQTLNLGSVDTTGLANGAYAVRVSLRTTDGAVLPGHASLAPFVVGLPLTASVSASATNLPPGTSTVTTTITVADPVPAGPPAGGDPGPAGGSGTPPSGDGGSTPPSPPVVDDALTWIGGTSGDWNVDANWLDTTNNTKHVPTATDAVTIDTPGAMVSINNTQQTALSIEVAAGSTLSLTNNAHLTLGANSSEVDGSLTVDSSTLILGGALTLAGTSQWLNTTTNDSLFLDAQTLTNRGAMTVGDAAGGTLQLLLHGGFSSGTLLNEGTITQQGTTAVSRDNDVVVNNSSSGTYNLAGDGKTDGFVNAGLVRKTAGTGTSALGAVFHDLPLSLTGGTLQVDTGTLLLSGNSDGSVVAASTGGSLVVAAGATLDLSDLGTNSTFTGTYTGSGAGTVLLAGGASDNLLIGSGGATFNFPAGMFQWTGGTINLQGNTLTNAGTLTLGSPTASTTETLEARTGISTVVPGGRLLNLGTIVQQGAGSLNVYDAGVVDNQGTYQLTGAGTIQNNSSTSGPASAFDNAGTLTMTGTGSADVTTTLDNSGTVRGQGGTLLLEGAVTNSGTIAADGAAVTARGAAIDTNRLDNGLGTWVARNGGMLTFSGSRPIVYSQVSLVADGATSTIAGLNSLATNAGTLTLTNGASLSISANLDNLGTIALGPGSTLNIAGSYTQEAAGTLDVQLGGAPASGAFGTLTASATATLGGLLRAELAGGYTPAAGDAFPVLTSATSGTFAGADLPATATTAFQAAVSGNALTLTARSARLTPTSVALTSDAANGTTFGQRITFTATVQAAGGTPTGAVQFQIDGANSGAPVPLSGGSARLTTVLDVGTHSVAAVYLGAASFAASDDLASPLRQTVNPEVSSTVSGLTLFYSQFGDHGPPQGVSQAVLTYDGTTLTAGTPVPIDTTSNPDGLLVLPNGNLLLGGNPVQEIDPTTDAVLASVAVEGDHLALDPSGLKVWTSVQGGFLGSPGGPLEELDLTNGLAEVTHPVQGDDQGATQLAFDTAGNAYYTNEGDFGVIDLTTFTTKRLFDHLPSAHGLCFDPYTGDLIMVNNSNIMQFDPRTGTVASSLTIPGGFSLDQGAADGKGHLFVGGNDGNLVFVDYSATGLVGDPRDFVATPFFAAHLDDVAPLSYLGSPGTPITVNDQLPATGYAIDPSSVVPDGALSSSGVVWHGQIPAGSTAPLTFQVTGQVTNLAPGEARPISLGTTVTAVVAGPGGAVVAVPIQLPPVFVTADHVINLTPTAQSAERGSSATYTVTLTNPLPTPQTYTLNVDGLAGLTTSLAPSVTVNPGQTASVPLQLTVPDGAIPGTQAFEVLAQTAAGASDAVEGQLTVLPGLVLPSLAVNLALTPTQATAGQGNPARYTLTVTNTGDTTDTYTLAGSFPAGVTGTFSTTTLTVPPGVSNFRDVQLTLTPSAGTAAGNDPFTVTATSATQASVASTASGTVTVVGRGVGVTFSPSSAAPGGTLQLMVTNTGQAADTFDLSLGGPAALVSNLGTARVTLAPGASQMVPVTTGAVNFADPGPLSLTGVATSEANSAVQAGASADLTIPTGQSMTAAFSPASQTVQVPGTGSFLLLVQNTGNTEDSYTATITGTTGPVSASLTGLDGSPTQTVPLFRLPGLSTGAILLSAALSGPSQGTVTVRVTSLSNPAVTSTATATVNTASPTTTALTSDHLTGSVYGQDVAFTATVTAAGGATPTGTVDFVDTTTGKDLGARTLQVVNGTAQASVTASGLGAGTHAVTASYTSDNTSAFGNSSTTLSQTVAGATLTVTAHDAGKVYGAALPAFTDTLSGFVNGDNAGVVSGTADLSTTATAGSGVGTYPVVAARGTLTAANYTFAFVNGTLTVTPATLTVTANSASKLEGLPNPPFTYTLSGFVNGDTAGVVTGTPGLTTTATTDSGIGLYPITVTQDTLHAANYTFAFVAGTLIVNEKLPPGFTAATGVTVQRVGKRGVPTSIVVAFNGPLDPATANVAGNYNAYVGGKQLHTKKKKRQRLVNVLAASYDPATNTVTLRIGKVKNRKTLGTLELTGLTDALGRPFEDGVPGVNVSFTVNLQSKKRAH
jgi:uncharacterized membrane protein